MTRPQTFRFFDNLPPGATVLLWRGHLFVFWPQGYEPPPPAAELRAVPIAGKVS